MGSGSLKRVKIVRVTRENWNSLNDDQKRGLIIKGYRRRYPYTIKTVSQLSGLKIGRLRDIEAGRRKPIKLEELLTLNKTCFLLPLMVFEHLFPEGVNPYDYVDDLKRKTKKKTQTRRKKRSL